MNIRIANTEAAARDVRAMTIFNPYAHAVARGEKIVENRDWVARWRGVLLIHAGKSRCWVDDEIEARYPHMVYQAIVAACVVRDWHPLRDIRKWARDGDPYWRRISRHEHTTGPVCIVLSRIRRLRYPVACGGRQGLWKPSQHIVRAVASQISELETTL